MITEILTSLADKVREKLNIEDSLTREQLIEKIKEIPAEELTTAQKIQKLANKELKYYRNNNITKIGSILKYSDLIELNCPKAIYLEHSLDHLYLLFTNIQKIDWAIPNKIMFQYQSKLTTLILRHPEVVPLTSQSNISYTKIPTSGYVYVPATLLEQYKIATNWTVFADRIRAIEDYPEITGGAIE